MPRGATRVLPLAHKITNMGRHALRRAQGLRRARAASGPRKDQDFGACTHFDRRVFV